MYSAAYNDYNRFVDLYHYFDFEFVEEVKNNNAEDEVINAMQIWSEQYPEEWQIIKDYSDYCFPSVEGER
jgi:hypothetical protein